MVPASKGGARRESLVVLPDLHAQAGGRLEISIKQKPEAGKANGRVQELVVKHYEVPAERVRIIKGKRSATKVLLVGKR